MDSPELYDFHIDRWTPSTLPMDRLAEYLTKLAALFGHSNQVHFSKVRSGSAVPEILVDAGAAPTVRTRLELVSNHDGPLEAQKTVPTINQMLRDDGTSAYLRRKGGPKIIVFPGVKTPLADEAIVHEAGELTGMVIRVGGKDDTVPLWLADSEHVLYRCSTSRTLARELAHHLFGDMVRVAGSGKWRRTEDRVWELLEFKVKSWEPLDQTSLVETVTKLRAVKGSGWNEMDDPQAALRSLRED